VIIREKLVNYDCLFASNDNQLKRTVAYTVVVAF